jgi:hypothetical protein
VWKMPLSVTVICDTARLDLINSVVKMTLAQMIWRNALQKLKWSSLMEKDLEILPSKLPPANEAFDNQILATHQTLSSFVVLKAWLCYPI